MVLQVSHLNKSYGSQVIFDDISFTVNPGERVGLVGRNGHGKTTLFRLILGQEEADTGTISRTNTYRINGLAQHIRFKEKSVLEEGGRHLKPSEEGIDETYKVKAILHGLGFTTSDFTRPPTELSGGYQVRLNLAKVLVAEPDLLLLDEPTNYLDIVSIRWLTRFLLGWKQELMLITHDRTFMDSVTTHTLGIHRCKVKKISGSTHKLYQQIHEEEKVLEQTRINEDKKRRESEQFINRFRAKASKAKAVQSRIKALERMNTTEELSEIKTLDFQFNALPFAGKSLMSVENLCFSFNPGDPPLIDGLSFFLGKRDRIGVIGRNGKGKTTLLNLLAREYTPTSGSIRRHTHLADAYFGQTNVDRLDRENTVEEEILSVQPDKNRNAVRNICGAIMFEGEKAFKKIKVLSGGEKSRVLLGKLLVTPANLLLLDEPSNHLDMESTQSLVEAIEAFDGAVLIVTHLEMLLHATAKKLIIFDNDEIRVFEGTYQDFLDRVGWTGEEELRQEEKPPQEAGASSPNRKELRRKRAALITERSKKLGSLEKQIARLEETIMELEDRVERETGELLEASEEGDGARIKGLSKSLHEGREKIDTLFDQLERLTGQYETQAKDFEEKLSS